MFGNWKPLRDFDSALKNRTILSGLLLSGLFSSQFLEEPCKSLGESFC